MNNQIKALVRLTVQDPRAAAAGLLSDKVATANALWLAALVVVVGVIISSLTALLLTGPANGLMDAFLGNPVLLAIIQFMLLMISAIAVFAVGRIFGGRGSFEQAVLVSAWLQFFMLLVQIALVPISLISSDFVDNLSFGIHIYSVWLMVNFIAELHGFRSRMKVLGGILATSFLVTFLVVFVLRILGVEVEGA